MRLLSFSVASTFALAPCLCAQSAHPLTVPEIFTATYAPGGNLLPFARTKGFIQTWYEGSHLPIPTVVTALGWRTDTAASGAPLTHTLEIVLDNTVKDFFTLDKTLRQQPQRHADQVLRAEEREPARHQRGGPGSAVDVDSR